VNPEAVKWLEELDENARVDYFKPCYPFDGKLYSFKDDHENPNGLRCWQCVTTGELLVIG